MTRPAADAFARTNADAIRTNWGFGILAFVLLCLAVMT